MKYITRGKITSSEQIPDSYLLTDRQAQIVQANYPHFDIMVVDDAVQITPYDPPSTDLTALKSTRITQTKTALETYLAEHPLLWTDGKHYSVTMDKQALLNNAIAVYQLGVQAGINPELTWNATGEECTEWEFNDLCALALGIAAYVKPLVAHQQALEVAIREAETAEELDAITVNYEMVNADQNGDN
jgi:hypothetical protein